MEVDRADSNVTESEDKRATLSPQPATSGRGSLRQSLPKISPLTAGGLMRDSVLEVKWRAQRLQERAQRETMPLPKCTPPPKDGIDWSQSDPFAAFSAFTRIAAPTAALGADDVQLNTRSLAPPLREEEDASISATEPLKPHLPYSAAHLARRMVRYFLARKDMEEFLTFFTGEFDNYDQIAEERADGMFPCEGGGHEHIHCSIVQPAENWLFARYYFNGNPNIVFRSRLYRVDVSDKSDRGIIEMRIFRFYEETEQLLKANNYNVQSVEWGDDDMYDWLEGCEVYWERYEPESEEADTASRALGIESGTRFVGYMKGGGCELFSREINARIRIMDDLLLTPQQLWVADRAFDEDGNFVYGNRRGIPYKMKRVDPSGPQAWTLSATSRPPEGYIP